MYKFKKVFIFVKEERLDVTHLLRALNFNSYDEAHELMKKEQIDYYMFIFEEVAE